MYAIIADGGRQYRVEEGQELDIDYREAATNGRRAGIRPRAGRLRRTRGCNWANRPSPGPKSRRKSWASSRGRKIYVQKLRRRKNFRRRTGHRQLYTRVRINRIETP